MGKFSELEMVISDLLSAATAITEAANALQEMFSTVKTENSPAPAPEKPKLSLEQVRAVLSDLSRKGYTADVRKLLIKHGADKLSQVAPSHYEALLADAAKLTKVEDQEDGT